MAFANMSQFSQRDPSLSVCAAQIRAARALVGWSQARLAEAAGLSVPTIKRMEGAVGPGRSAADNVAAVVRALRLAGVEFTNGAAPGVRLKPKASFVRPEDLTSETDL